MIVVNKGTALYDIFMTLAKQQGWHPEIKDDCIRMDIMTKKGQWIAFARADDEEKWFAFYALFSVSIPEEKLGAVAKTLHQLNYGLKEGCFELDYETKTVHLRTSAYIVSDITAADQMLHTVTANVQIFDQFLLTLNEHIAL